MRVPVLGLLLALVPVLSAQVIEIYPGSTNFTSRGSLGTGTGELLQGFHASQWRAIGSVGVPGAFLRGVRYVLQDQNAAIQDAYEVLVRSGTDPAGPATGSRGVLCSSGVLRLPPAAGPMAWTVTTRFVTPCAIPSDGFVAAGLSVAANPAWSADGLSVHMATLEQHVGPHRQDHAWEINGAAGAANHPVPPRSWRIALLSEGPIVQNGVFVAGTSEFIRGAGGMFPPFGTHGWSTHVDGGLTYGNGIARVFLVPQLLPQPVHAPFILGSIHAGPGSIPLATLFLDGNGRADLKVADPIRRFGATVWIQAAVIDNSLIRLAVTNANATTFQ